MSVSFLEISRRMDALAPPVTLRELGRRHRWAETGTPHRVSLRAIADRHNDPATRSFRFLSYNTFLLPGVNITYDLSETLLTLGINATEALLELALSPEELLRTVERGAMEVVEKLFSPIELAKDLGLDMGVLEGAAKAALDIADFLTAGVFDLASNLTFEIVFEVYGKSALHALNDIGVEVLDILNVLGILPIDVLVRVILLSGKLVLGAFGVEIPYPVRIGAKAALRERAVAIGQALAGQGYDVMALSEVWDQDPSARDAIRGGWAGAPKPLTEPAAQGERAPSRLLDSGLYRLCAGEAQIQETVARSFDAAGNKLLDTDAWASKGVLLTRIRLGAGVVDLYNAHLISGGDFPLIEAFKVVTPAFAAQSSDEALNAKRLAQVDELVAFIRDTHRPENVAIFCGDMNIEAVSFDGRDMPTYQAMKHKLSTVGLRDAWAWQQSFQPKLEGRIGPTHGAEDAGRERFNNGICTVLRPDTAGNPANVGFCNDNEEPTNSGDVNAGAGRIDYIFVEDPTPLHTYTLDMTRIRRNPFEWSGLPENQAYLSDHIGQDTTLIVGPLRR
ncbi:endonuclease/exonuclease/phosphatase family protein [Roseomonas sp. GCM10028921]